MGSGATQMADAALSHLLRSEERVRVLFWLWSAPVCNQAIGLNYISLTYVLLPRTCIGGKMCVQFFCCECSIKCVAQAPKSPFCQSLLLVPYAAFLCGWGGIFGGTFVERGFVCLVFHLALLSSGFVASWINPHAAEAVRARPHQPRAPGCFAPGCRTFASRPSRCADSASS